LKVLFGLENGGFGISLVWILHGWIVRYFV